MEVKLFVYRILFVFSFVTLSACTDIIPYQVSLLPAPDVYAKKLVNPFPKENVMDSSPYKGILYVTDRLPSSRDFDEIYYRNKRGGFLRLGIADIEIERQNGFVRTESIWKELVEISTTKERDQSYALQVKELKELGIFDRSGNVFREIPIKGGTLHEPTQKFTKLINQKLAMSRKKDVYIYVHGYNTVFEYSLLTGLELWHYLGYDGVFIAYAWPTTPRGLAYFADMDTARVTSRNLRFFLEYLSEETNVENIHIVAHSMGTRVVTFALEDIALMYQGKTYPEIKKKVKVGNVILIGSDVEVTIFGGYLLDGILDTTKSLTIYTSDNDTALSASRWLFERQRLGESWRNRKVSMAGKKYLKKNKKLRIIDVTEAEDADVGLGHSYFIDSMWVSSDVLLTLGYDLSPKQRGLVLDNKTNMWHFSEDYLERVATELKKIDPKLINVRSLK